MIVISDTSPLNYLVMVGKQDILPMLFGKIIVPEAVMRELQARAAPPEVRQWLRTRPNWLEMKHDFLERDARRKASRQKPE